MLGLPASGRRRGVGATVLAPDSPPFRFWLRRTGASEPTYALRFEVVDGKGVLRVARPGVLVDPPARDSGSELDLTLAQVRASRFLHVSALDRRRQLYFLSRVPEELAGRLKAGAWVELGAAVDRGAHYLLLDPPDEPLEGHVGPPDTPSTPDPPPQAMDIPALPPESLTPLADPNADSWAEIPPPTSLIRYLRRQLSEARRENAALLARIASLERRLAQARSAPLDVDGGKGA